MRIAAIVVHHRTPDDTALAVRSLFTANRRPDETIVVNNDDHDDGGRFLDEDRAQVTWLHAGRNLGFSGGVNVGIRSANKGRAEAVLLVNSDVVVRPDCLEGLELTIARDPSLGIAAPIVVSRREPDRVVSMGIDYNPTTGRMRHLGFNTHLQGVRHTAPRAVPAVAGCLMLIRQSVFEQVGLFDEDFFFGFEELEFCLRARRAGFTTMLAPTAVAYHEGSRSIGSDSPRRLYFAARNHLLLAYKMAPAESRLVRLPRVVSIAGLNVAHALGADGGTLAGRLRAVTHGIIDYVNGRFGEDRHEW